MLAAADSHTVAVDGGSVPLIDIAELQATTVAVGISSQLPCIAAFREFGARGPRCGQQRARPSLPSGTLRWGIPPASTAGSGGALTRYCLARSKSQFRP